MRALPQCLAVLVVFTALMVTPLATPPAGAQSEGEVRAPFVTTPAEVVERMLALAGTGPRDLVYDLGSGDGRIPIAAARRFGARGVGLELDPALVEKSRQAAREAGVAERTEFRVEDVLRADLAPASVVTIYLLPSLMAQLGPRLLYELKPGTRIVTHAFVFPSWKPDRVERVVLAERRFGQSDESTVMMWVVPAQARGRYGAVAGPQPTGEGRLEIAQNFQEIEIEGSLAGQPLRFESARLSGNEITWSGSARTAQGDRPMRFSGRVLADRILGEMQLGSGAAVPFAALRQP